MACFAPLKQAAGAATAHDVVSGQRFEVRRTTCGGNRVVEAEWTATLLMNLPHWDPVEVIRARIASVFEVRDGRIAGQDSYFTPSRATARRTRRKTDSRQ